MVLPPARTRASLLERLLRPVSSVLFAFVAAAPALVHAASDPAPAEPEDDRPPEERFTAPVSADCDHRMPLWEHVVAEGEHLGLIAGRYGVRRRDLVALNPDLTNPDLIRPGQKIRVCPEIAPRLRKQVVYTVRPGDTLGAIAVEHGLTLRELMEAQENPPSDPNLVRVGQTLTFWVDGGVVPEFQPPPAKPKKRSRSRVGTRLRRPVEHQLPESPHYVVKRPRLAYGTEKTIRLLQEVVTRYRKRVRGGPRLHIGDISKRGGGELPPHVSHRRGTDVDVGYVLRGKDANRIRFSGVNKENLDVARTWALLRAFLDTHQVRYIFVDYAIQEQLYEYARKHGASENELDELFQYPRGRGRSHGIIRHWPSHKNHFHVRFRQ